MSFWKHFYQSERTPRLSIVEGGEPEAETLLFLHGGGGSAGNFDPQLAFFSRSYRVVAPEMRGHGGSQWEEPRSLEELHQDLAEVVEFCRLPERFAVVAHSFGGCLGIRLANTMADRVAGLALLNSGGHMPQGIVFRGCLLFSNQVDRFRRWFPSMLQADSRVCAFVLRRLVRQWNSWEEASRLSMPCLLLAGARDHLIPAGLTRRTAEVIPRSRFHLLRDSGHVCMREAVQATNQLLADWLSAEVFGVESFERG